MKKAWNSSWSKAYNIICETWWSSVMAWACMASSGTGLLVFSDDVTEDRSSWKNQVYRDILSAQIQPNAAKLIRWCFIVEVDNDPKHTAKSTQEFLKVKKVEYSTMAKSISWSQPDWACISPAEDKTKGRKTHKQTSQLQQRPGKASQMRKPNLWWCPWVPDLRQSWPAMDSQQNI